MELRTDGKISIKTPCQLETIEGDKSIKSITIKFYNPNIIYYLAQNLAIDSRKFSATDSEILFI